MATRAPHGARREQQGGETAAALERFPRGWGCGVGALHARSICASHDRCTARLSGLALSPAVSSCSTIIGRAAAAVVLVPCGWRIAQRHRVTLPPPLPARPPLRYDGLDQTIINASLVPCRPGVFASEGTPTYLLLLSTPSEVRLHAASSEIRPRL